jgi:predicted ATPase
MNVVGISGAQGSGKSTLLLELKNRGWDLDGFKVSRAVQAALGWDSLERVMDSWDTMKKFQEEVFYQKGVNDQILADTDIPSDMPQHTVILTERTFADIDAYTTLWAWRHAENGNASHAEVMEFLLKYHRGNVDAQKRVYSAVILLPLMSHIPWEDDTHRASKNDAETIYEHIERFQAGRDLMLQPKLVVTGRTVHERADQVEQFLNMFFTQMNFQ